MKFRWFVTESVIGAITLWVYGKKELVYVHTGYQYHAPESLRKDVASLLRGDNPRLWSGNNFTMTPTDENYLIDRDGHTTLQKLKPEEQPWTFEYLHIESKTIYNWDGPKTKNMGAAGKRIFAELIEGDKQCFSNGN